LDYPERLLFEIPHPKTPANIHTKMIANGYPAGKVLNQPVPGKINVRQRINISTIIVPDNPMVEIVMKGNTAKRNSISTRLKRKKALNMVKLTPTNQKTCAGT